MNSKTGKLYNFKFTLLAAEALDNHDYYTNELFDKDTVNKNHEKNQQIHKYINEKYQNINICTVHHKKKKRIAEDSNLDLVS